jgi:hypothetical protein
MSDFRACSDEQIAPDNSGFPKNLPLRGGQGWERAQLLARHYNLFQHLFNVLLDLDILETNHAIAVGFKLFSAGLVVFGLLGVNAAINLDDEPMFGTIEIGDE